MRNLISPSLKVNYSVVKKYKTLGNSITQKAWYLVPSDVPVVSESEEESDEIGESECLDTQGRGRGPGRVRVGGRGRGRTGGMGRGRGRGRAGGMGRGRGRGGAGRRGRGRGRQAFRGRPSVIPWLLTTPATDQQPPPKPFTATKATNLNLPDDPQPIDFFCQLVDDDILQLLANETNR